MNYLDLAREDLARSGLTMQQAGIAGMLAAPDASAVHPSYHEIPALVIPYPDPESGGYYTLPDGRPYTRVRYLGDLPPQAGGNPFKAPKLQRYAQPPDSAVHAYFPHTHGVNWRTVAADPSAALLIVEGEKKALAATVAGFPTIGLGGVYNYMERGRLLPELERIRCKGRKVYIVFDSDAAHNPHIQAAEARLAAELSMARGAALYLVRIPQDADAKVGVDDLLVSSGPSALQSLLDSAQRLRKIDTAVVGMNESVAWIEKEGCVYDLRSKEFIQKSNFTNGSVYSSVTVTMPKLTGSGVKQVSVAEEWLKHPHAQRYDYVMFRPDDPSAVLHTDAGGLALNMWTGWKPEPGDAQPFLDLSEFLFSDLEGGADLPIKLLAYKAQNPGSKVPLAMVLVGPQGCGKSLWAECVRDAFSPYTAEVPTAALGGQFNGWTERTLIAVVNEATGDILKRYAPQLRSLISDKRVMLNEKFRIARQIDSYTQYIITANDRGAGAYSADDRRMIVVSTPPKREASFYRRIAEWKRDGGGPQLLHYLLNYDLQGWEPPQQAPMTAEKYMAYMESLSPVERLAEEMRTADENVVVMWIQQALAWARHAELSNNPVQARYAQEIIDSLASIQIRPWYTPEELAMMFPSIVSQLHGTRTHSARPAGQISKELRTAGISYLRPADDPRGFRWRGSMRQYLVVADAEEWSEPLPQAEFDRLMQQFPSYANSPWGRRNGHP